MIRIHSFAALPTDPTARALVLDRLRQECTHPHGGSPRCPLCGAWPSRTALAAAILAREPDHPLHVQCRTPAADFAPGGPRDR